MLFHKDVTDMRETDVNYGTRKSCMRHTVENIRVCFVLTLDMLKSIRIKILPKYLSPSLFLNRV